MAQTEFRRVAVVMFNLGGPDSLEAVQPFLQNLFSDPAILRVPRLVRWVLARLIARRRAAKAQGIYMAIGGRSPLLPNTIAQGEALEIALSAKLAADTTVKCFPVMRYWHPFAPEVAALVDDYRPDIVVELPLYPQLSTTTSVSSFKDWSVAVKKSSARVVSKQICCYPENEGFIKASAELIAAGLRDQKARGYEEQRVLFSAHGLPESVVASGDPYQWQVERSAAAVAARLSLEQDEWVVCYQSRVGPLKWIGPATEDEIIRAGQDKRAVVLYPIAFVSEHSETLVELDQEYRHLAEEAGIVDYCRIPTVSTHPAFISGLADLVLAALSCKERIHGPGAEQGCPMSKSGCPRLVEKASL